MKNLPYAIAVLLILGVANSVFAQQGPDKPIGVFVAPVKETMFVDQVDALGSLKANQNVALAATVTELITSIEFTDRQRVKRGDLLLEMDSSEEMAVLAEEQIRVDEAQRRVDRVKPLIKRGAAAEATLDESQSSLSAAQARVRAVQARIDQRRILAPFDGVLGLRNVSVGALVQPGTIISTIDDDSVMKLDFSVPEVFLQQLRPGIEIKATPAHSRVRLTSEPLLAWTAELTLSRARLLCAWCCNKIRAKLP